MTRFGPVFRPAPPLVGMAAPLAQTPGSTAEAVVSGAAGVDQYPDEPEFAEKAASVAPQARQLAPPRQSTAQPLGGSLLRTVSIGNWRVNPRQFRG